MTKNEFEACVKLLKESGVTLSSTMDLRAALKAAATTLGLSLDNSDLEALSESQSRSATASELKPTFLVDVFRIKQYSVRYNRFPSRRDPKPKQKATPIPGPVPLPPWGQMEDDLCVSQELCRVPIDWTPPDKTPPTRANWGVWLDELKKVISTALWPAYSAGKWDTLPVGPLFDADFEVLDTLRDYIGMPISAMYPTQVQHRDFFLEEDNSTIEFGSGYERYDPTLSPEILKGLPNFIGGGIADKVSTMDLQLKHTFQRPRPWQIALIQDRKDYAYDWAQTANTPSLVSGHCLQASIGVTTAYVALADGPLKNRADSVALLQQFAMDVGDRRVFAGVHYPSDNLASWFVALSLLPRVYDRQSEKSQKVSLGSDREEYGIQRDERLHECWAIPV